MMVPQSLETDRLEIRRYVEDDLEGFHRFLNNEEITGTTDMPLHRSFEETKQFLNVLVKSYNTDNPLFAMAICNKDNGKVIGSCGFAELEFSPDVQIYYALDSKYRGNGYATEAVEKMIEYMIIVLNIEIISIFCPPVNIASIDLAKRVGMQYHGICRKGEENYEYYVLTREMYLSGS